MSDTVIIPDEKIQLLYLRNRGREQVYTTSHEKIQLYSREREYLVRVEYYNAKYKKIFKG